MHEPVLREIWYSIDDYFTEVLTQVLFVTNEAFNVSVLTMELITGMTDGSETEVSSELGAKN